MTKILFDAVDVKAMLDRHPEIEAELTKNAAAQIAEQFKRKVLNDTGTLVDRLIAEINQKLNYKYSLPDVVLKGIRSATEDHMQRLNEEQARKQASKLFDEALKRYAETLEKRMDAIATSLVEAKVAAVFKAAAKMK